MNALKPGFALIQSVVNPDTVLVRVDTDALTCDVRPLPYPTYIGTISRTTRKVSGWTPAASTPRGYRKAAKAELEEIASMPCLHCTGTL